MTIGTKVAGKGLNSEDSPGENFDFNVEHVNKNLKSSLIWAPTNGAWLLACRTYDLFMSLTSVAAKWINLFRC